MITFSRYPHVHDLIQDYASEANRKDIRAIMKTGIQTKQDAIAFCEFVWELAEHIDDDKTEMIPDLCYETTLLMKNRGYMYIWREIAARRNPE